MKRKPVTLFAACCVAGLLLGYSGKRLSRPAMVAAEIPAATKTKRDVASHTAPLPSSSATTIAETPPRPTDTLESLKADEADLYPRLAQWLLHASSAEIAGYCDHHFKRPERERDREISNLIFINWARLDPDGAVAANKGTAREGFAWWARGYHDPAGALAAALATAPEHLKSIGPALGVYHPAWLREHYDELPEELRKSAAGHLSQADGDPDPLATLEFMSAKGLGNASAVLNTLAERDPWAAYDWLQKNKGSSGSPGSSEAIMTSFIKTLGEQHPEVLARIVEMTPSGERKRKMEAQVFSNLVKNDPEAAVQAAKGTKAPLVAVERLATIGTTLVATQPDRAFEIAAQMLTLAPDALRGGGTVVFEGGISTWGNSSSGPAPDFVDRLMASDPRRAMDLFLQPEVSGEDFLHAAKNWTQRDTPAYAGWVDALTDPGIRDRAAEPLIEQLVKTYDYSGAADWAKSMKSPDQRLENVIAHWGHRNPDEARAWVEGAGLPEATVHQLNRYLKPKQ